MSEMSVYRGPESLELLAVVADFLESKIAPAFAKDRRKYDAVCEAAAALRIVEREILENSAHEAQRRDALAELGYSDEAQLAAAIRSGDLDDRAAEVVACLRTLTSHHLATTNPGYRDE
ncbi:DUF6285 domain-containing protein [Mycobacterium bourgelatii]|uniref:DUF6285 domain-containing protein n=1 Tax=Mycobacterium bourgelatii TaxID=1273442 RepID=UPI001F07E528